MAETFWVLVVKCGQEWVLCSDTGDQDCLRPLYSVCLSSEAWSFPSAEEAMDQGMSQAFPDGSYRAVEVCSETYQPV